ncbi:MAG: helix-turn-helix domain-containing protein [Chitinophagaceae bacterium]
MNSPLFNISLYDLAFLGILFTGLTFVCLLLFTKRNNRTANAFLGAALFVAIFWIAQILLIDTGFKKLLRFQFSLAFGPLIYFYVLTITRPENRFHPKALVHFVPVVVELFFPRVNVLDFFSVIIYLYLGDRLIEAFYQRLQFNELNDRYRSQLRWLRKLLKGFALLWLLWIPYVIASYFTPLPAATYYPYYILLSVCFIRIAVICFFREDLRVPVPAAISNRPSVPPDLQQKGAWLKKLMEKNLYYRDPDIGLRSLAEKLELKPNELSRIINSALHKSFTDFINEYRVTEVARKMKDPANDKLTLIGIAMDAGFNSKSTFNRIFKEMTGKTPAEFKRQRENCLPDYTLRPYSRAARILSGNEAPTVWLRTNLKESICSDLISKPPGGI